MKNLANTIVTVAVTFLVTLALQTAIGYFTQPQGAVLPGPPTTIQNQVYMPVDITNFIDKPLDNLILSIPKLTDIPEIVSSSPIQIEEVPDVVGTTNRKRIQISGLEPNQVTRLLIPIANQNEAELFRVVNAAQMKLTIESAEHVQSPLIRIFEDALLTATLYAILMSITVFWISAQNQRIREELQKARQEAQAYEARLMEIDRQTSEVRATLYRYKILLLAKISDYSKELDFWRDTIRKILYQTTGDDTTAETVISQVTKTLQTYGTLSKVPEEFEEMKVIAEILSNSRDSKSEHKQKEP